MDGIELNLFCVFSLGQIVWAYSSFKFGPNFSWILTVTFSC